MRVAPWVRDELVTADLNDDRLDRRFEWVLSRLAERPGLSIPAACGGRAEMTATYRFFDNAKVTFEAVLGPHAERTLERVGAAGERIVALVQDTTEVDLTRPGSAVAGAGELSDGRCGVLAHVLHAFTGDGTPLGTAWGRVLNRTEEAESGSGVKDDRKHTRIEDKESERWLAGLREARRVAESVESAGVRCVCVADSEADVYELLCEPRGPLELLIRACQDRAMQTDTGERLRGKLMSGRVLYTAELAIRGRRAKTGAQTRRRRQTREDRRASVEVRAATVTLRPPWRFDRRLEAVTLNAVLVSEPNPPAGEAAIEWMLLTTLAIQTPDQVRTVVELYGVRWSIELLFRTLKSGCRVEHRRFEHVDRMLPCLALMLIVAWRTLHVCRQARRSPEADCEVVFEASEWKAVWAVTHATRRPPSKPPTLGRMVRLIATLGGYIERSDSEPGPQTVWIGLQRMHDLAWAWDAFGPEVQSRGGRDV